MNRFAVAVFACGSALLGPAFADEPVPEHLTLDGALARARTHSPAVLEARARIEEARARLAGAGRPRENPQIEAAAGHRQDGTGWDLDVGISQPLEMGGRRGARVAGARAVLERDVANAEDALRRAQRDVAGAYVAAAAAQGRARVAATAAAFAEEVVRIARRRHEAGDVAALDVNVAQSGLARARADVHSIGAAHAAALGTLRSLLALEATVPLVLDDDGTRAPVDPATLLSRADDRPDVRAVQAELGEAEADARLGRSLAWPDVSPTVRYERDAGTNVLWGGLTVSIPLLNRGQETRDAGDARARRLRSQLAALRLSVRNEILTGWTVYSLRQKAADELRAQVDALDDNDALARRSYEVGQIGLGELLLVRRETSEARSALIERVAEAAEARIDLEARAGVLR